MTEIKRKWLPGDDARLEQLLQRKASRIRIAIALNRSTADVKAKASVLSRWNAGLIPWQEVIVAD